MYYNCSDCHIYFREDKIEDVLMTFILSLVEYDEVVKKYYYPILAEKEDVNTKSIDEQIKELNEQNATLKKKQKGRNRDINVNDMGVYSELKREQEKNTKRLKEANSKSDNLDVKTQEIKEILNNLKSPLLEKKFQKIKEVIQ